MLAEFWGDTDGSFFSYDEIVKNRKIEYPIYPDRLSNKLVANAKIKIPHKISGELRILSADIALMASTKHKNDASAIFINQMMPTKAGRYVSNIVYTETSEGLRTEEQALAIRKLFDEYECDYIVLDCKGIGFGVFDALSNDIVDIDSGEIYPALSCYNNAEFAARCADRNAKKVIWAINGNAKFNSECAVMLREGFKNNKIRLLETEYDGEKLLADLRGFTGLSTSDQSQLLLPYMNTTLLINELVNLQHEETNGLIRVKEKSGMRKDRYSSLSYNYWVANQIESTIRRKTKSGGDEIDIFMFRAPKIK